MRDKRFVAVHRGGSLKKAQHLHLMKWANQCSNHVLHLFGEKIDERLVNALSVAKEWEFGEATVGDARKAALQAIAVANESSNPVAVSVARSVGHAVATAHMADHSIDAALYALKAVNSAGNSVEKEKKWQNNWLPSELKEPVLNAMAEKEKHFKL
jgi:hypothetical protein